jgi:hypothetical protein
LVVPSTSHAATREEDEPVLPIMAMPAAAALVDQYFHDVRAAVGGTVERDYGTNPAPCQGRNGELADDGRYYVQGTYRIALAPGSHIAALTAMRDRWVGQGLELRDFRTLADGGATVSARNPADGVQVTLMSTSPPSGVAVIIVSPCLLPLVDDRT